LRFWRGKVVNTRFCIFVLVLLRERGEKEREKIVYRHFCNVLLAFVERERGRERERISK
jgi:hypothetical protein